MYQSLTRCVAEDSPLFNWLVSLYPAWCAAGQRPWATKTLLPGWAESPAVPRPHPAWRRPRTPAGRR